MSTREIRPFDEASLPELGDFLTRSVAALVGGPGTAPGPLPAGEAFRWLLDEGNPARPEGLPPGEVLRDGEGKIVGMIGYHPVIFRYQDRRLLGLGAHNFYVDPAARMQGFFLFRRYLNQPSADFCYSTTCNANSGPLWLKCGAEVLPGSNTEYVRVFRAGPLIEELAIRRGVPRAVASPLRLAGSLANVALRPPRARAGLKVERCRDWERLSEIAARARDPGRLTPERSPEDLRRRHQARAEQAAQSGGAEGAYVFRDPAGREGWFALAEKTRGQSDRPIATLEVVDVVWPRDAFPFETVLATILRVAAGRTDLVSLRDRSGWGLYPGLLGLRQRVLPDPEAFVHVGGRPGLPGAAELARIIDVPGAYAA